MEVAHQLWVVLEVTQLIFPQIDMEIHLLPMEALDLQVFMGLPQLTVTPQHLHG